MKPRDVIVFDGRAGFSALIKLLTHSQYSHVGMVLKEQSALFGETLLLIELTTEVKLMDADGRQAIKGVHLHFLSQRLLTFEGSASWIPLKSPIPQQPFEKMLNWLRNVYSEKVPYSFARACGVALAKIEDACGKEMKPNYSTLFCSELVTRALQVAGVVDSQVAPTSQTSTDVIGFSCFEKPVQIKDGHDLPVSS